MINRLETREVRDKKTRNRNVVLGIIIAVIMVAGTVGWAVTSGDNQGNNAESYNGFSFTQNNGYWISSIQLNNQIYPIQTIYLPKEVDNITSEGILSLEKFSGKTLYLSVYTLEERQAALEIANNLQLFVNRIQFSCYADINDSFCLDKPIKTCNDTSLDSAIIVIQENNLTKSSYSLGCLTINANAENLLKVADRSIFAIFGVIK